MNYSPSGELDFSYLAAIIRKRVNLDTGLYTILQIPSVTLLGKIPLKQTLSHSEHTIEIPAHPNPHIAPVRS